MILAMIKIASGLVVAVGVVIGVSACSSGDSGGALSGASPGLSGGTNVAETPSVQPSVTFSPGMAGPMPGTPLENPFGSTVTFTNNAKVTVGKPKSFSPSSSAAGHEKGNRAFVQKVSLTNASTTESFQAVWVRTSATTENGECRPVFDDGLSVTPQIVLRPGKSTSWDQGFSCSGGKKGAELMVNVIAAARYNVGEANESAVFVGTLP